MTSYWAERQRPNVHLFHYTDLWEDLEDEMRRVAAALDVSIEESRWPEFVDAATLDSMASRAAQTAPEAHLGFWRDTNEFFRSGGTRDWTDHLTPSDIAHFHERLTRLAGDAAPWVLAGRAGIHS